MQKGKVNSNVFELLRIVFRTRRGLIAAFATIAVLQFVASVALVFALTRVAISEGDLSTSWYVYLGLLVISAALIPIVSGVSSYLSNDLFHEVNSRLVTGLRSVPYSQFERRDSQSEILLVLREGVYRAEELVRATVGLGTSIPATLGTAIGLVPVLGTWLLVPVAFAAGALALERWVGQQFARRIRSHSDNNALIGFVGQMATEASWRRELQLAPDDVLGEYFAGKSALLRSEMGQTIVSTATRRAIFGAVQVLFVTVLLGLVVATRLETVVVGDLLAFVGGFGALTAAFGSVARNFSDVMETSHFAEDIVAGLDRAQRQSASVARLDPTNGDASVKLSNVGVSYGDREILRNVDLNLTPGINLLVGPNGAGKSTLIKVIAGLLEPDAGQVSAIAPTTAPPAVLFQNPAQFYLPVAQAVSLETDPDLEKVNELLTRVGLEQLTELPETSILGPGFGAGVELSGGQWQRLAIARFLYRLDQANLVLIDEPLNSLDYLGEQAIMDVITSNCAGKVVVIVSHRHEMRSIADRILVVDKGTVYDNT